ncbi:uncharacterized protein LOC136081745 [Hydra vulgaris]|uniref:Uncharacterized protein LOC136081745 n=1 Tax=Hydra vulgaris TaxID=6087 RepID=A0ABM4C2H8_HYDVU
MNSENTQCTVQTVINKLNRLYKEIQVLKKRLTINWNSLIKVLEEKFIVTPVKHKISNFIFKNEHVSDAKKLKTSEIEMQCKKSIRVINHLKQQIRFLKHENFKLKRKLNLKNCMKEKILKEKLLLEKANTNSSHCLVTKQKLKQMELKKVIKCKNSENACLQMYVDELKGKLDLAQKSSPTKILKIKTTESKHCYYDVPLRKCVYMCLLNQVPIENIGILIKFIIKELALKYVVNIPVPSTLAQMAYELGVISDIQVAEHIYFSSSAVATLSWDSTSFDGVHINECHISIDRKQLTIQIAELSGGKTNNYMEHLINAIQDLASTYSLFSGIQQHVILHRFVNTFHSTLADRVSVNNCVNRELSKFFGKQLLALHCNVHPLEGLATKARTLLHQYDSKMGIKSEIYGTEGRAANLLYAVSKLRYKMKSGDPAGFETFLTSIGLRLGTIARYVGNRLHILFHLAGTVYWMRDNFIIYLKKYCKAKQLRLALLADFQNPCIIMQLRILGLYGKLITGPWMTQFYKNMDNRSHMEMIPLMKLCLSWLELVRDDPFQVISSKVDCFGAEVLSNDVILASLRKENFDELSIHVVKSLASGFLVVLERQLKQYLTGNLSNATPEILQSASSAPVHNMHSERVLGMVDSQNKRAPNATTGFLDSKVKSKINKTMDWLLEKSEVKQKAIIMFAITQGSITRKCLSTRKEGMRAAANMHQQETAQNRDKLERKKMERSINADLNDGLEPIAFSVLSEKMKTFALAVLNKDSNILGMDINHIWEVDGKDIICCGSIMSFSFKKTLEFVNILYVDDSGITNILIREFLTDIVLGDVSLPAVL